jgi:hypothetical protein
MIPLSTDTCISKHKIPANLVGEADDCQKEGYNPFQKLKTVHDHLKIFSIQKKFS